MKIEKWDLEFHPNLLETRQEKRAVQRLSKHVTLVIARRAIRKGAIKLWLRINFAREDVLFHFGIERLMKSANASPLHTG